MRKVLRLLLSRRNAAGALALLAVLVALAALVPDAEAIDDIARHHALAARVLGRLRPAEIARSAVVWLLAGYVAAAVVASMATRIAARRKATSRVRLPPLERFVVRRVVCVRASADVAERRVRAAARSAGFRQGGGLAGAGGGAGFWGSMAFHTGLLLVLAGIVLSALLRFEGELVLTEGFRLPLSRAAFIRASPPEAIRELAGTRLVVSDVSASYAQGAQLTDVSAVITVERPGAPRTPRFTSVNVPVDVAGFQLTVQSYGYAPELRAVDSTGSVRAEGNVVLRLLPPGTEDVVMLGDGGTLRLRFYPDHVIEGAEDSTRSLVPTNPVLRFRWYEGATLVAEGRVARGEEAHVGSYAVAFPDFAYWLRLFVVRDPGLPWFAAGGLLGAMGLAIRMLFYERSWRAHLEPRDGGTAIELCVSARYYPARLEEKAARFLRAIEGSGDA